MSPVNSPITHLISIDDLDTAIVSCAARINAATYDLLLLVRQFDERAGFLRWGLDNCAEWLSWRCDLSLITAKESYEWPMRSRCCQRSRWPFPRVSCPTPRCEN